MKNVVTKLMICAAVALIGFASVANAQCPNYTYYPKSQKSGWNSSEWYKVIDLDAATLTDATKYPRTGALDGLDDNVDFSTNTLLAPTGDGTITVPLYDTDASGNSYPSGQNYDIKFVRCVFAPEHYTSAYTKIEDYGTLPAGKDDPCTINDNSCLVGNVYGKQGFIELSRQAAGEGEPLSAKCGYLQLDNLYGVERIQWSYSSTSWKRGVICEVRMGGEDAEWTKMRVIPSDTYRYATFAEQGYEFEESIGLTGEDDQNIPLSIRFRIFDCDTLTWAHEYNLDPSQRSEEYYYARPSALQVVRIHQIKVFSALQGSEMALKNPLSIGENKFDNSFVIRKVGSDICASKECVMEIYTIDGKQVKRGKGAQMDISDVSKGIYVVKATRPDGEVKNIKISI